MSDAYILAIDNGTQSVRALLFDLDGELVAKSQVLLDAYYSTHPGWAEHDVEGYWQALCTACQRLWAENTLRKEAIKAVGSTPRPPAGRIPQHRFAARAATTCTASTEGSMTPPSSSQARPRPGPSRQSSPPGATRPT